MIKKIGSVLLLLVLAGTCVFVVGKRDGAIIEHGGAILFGPGSGNSAGTDGSSSYVIAETPEPSPTPEPTPVPTPNPYPNGFDICGKHYTTESVSIDMTGASEEDINKFCEAAPHMVMLKSVEFGNEETDKVSWEALALMREAAPDAAFNYSFSLYGQPMTLETEYIDLRQISVDDNGAAVMAALPCMTNCKYLDMDRSGVDNEHMEIIRDTFPNVKVVWRVYFSTMDYSCRTDVKTILASLTGVGDYAGFTNEESEKPLFYCTDVVNLDVGHNSNMRSLAFLKYMPNLEVFITYENYLRDISDLAYCKKLRYLELFVSSMYDCSVIAELDNLTDLMLCACYNLSDISALVPADKLTKLERFYIAGTASYIPSEQIEEFKKNHPNCEVNTTENSVGEHWRFIDTSIGNSVENRQPRYQEMCEIFHYNADNRQAYNFSSNDPYFTTPHGQEVTGERIEWFYGKDYPQY